MSGYRFNQRLDEALEGQLPALGDAVREHRGALLDGEAIERFEALQMPHAKLRELVRELLDEGGQWAMLWMPPTVPYWPLRGAWEGRGDETKTLVFSAWNVVPDVLSAMLSYEADRRMVDGRLSRYRSAEERVAPPLRLGVSPTGRATGHRAFQLLLPCLPLADDAHPLGAPEGEDREAWVRGRVRELLARLPDPQGEAADDRWEYMLPVLLDPGLRGFLERWRAGRLELECPYLDAFELVATELIETPVEALGARPAGLEEIAVSLALGAPAVLAARTAAATTRDPESRRLLAARIAASFWPMFNGRTAVKLVERVQVSGRGHWRRVLRYCADGNLQAVLDEAWHGLVDRLQWGASSESVLAERCADTHSRRRWIRPGRSSEQQSLRRTTMACAPTYLSSTSRSRCASVRR